MANRSMHAEIQTFVGRSVDSELSGNMIDSGLPVGALTSKPFRYSARSRLSRRKSVSPHDSIGSNLTVQVKGNRVMRVLPRERRDQRMAGSPIRTVSRTKDSIHPRACKTDDPRRWRPLREVEWNVALDYVAHALKDIAKTHGGESIAALVCRIQRLKSCICLFSISIGSNR